MSEDMVRRFHTDLRKIKGKFAIFLGAGSSYDYGIPTMDEMAKILHQQVIDKKDDHGITKETRELLVVLTGVSEDKNTDQPLCTWNIEDLLTRFHQIREVIEHKNQPFVAVDTRIGGKMFTPDQIATAENELIDFMVNLTQLDVSNKDSFPHGDGSIAYISDFIELMGKFQKTVNIFTTNIDLCVEAAIVKLSQLPKGKRQNHFHLIDGFSPGIVPIFDITNFVWKPTDAHRDTIPVYYWKLHGSIDWTYSMPFNDSKYVPSVEFGDDAVICRRISDDQWKVLHKCGALATPEEAKSQKAVIFPTPIKYSQTYTNPYMDLYEAFRRTLEEVELILAVGTSFPDQHIKSAIRSFVQRKNTLLYVVDPAPSMNRDKLISLFGNSNAIQDVINLGFKDFVKHLKDAEKLDIAVEVTTSE